MLLLTHLDQKMVEYLLPKRSLKFLEKSTFLAILLRNWLESQFLTNFKRWFWSLDDQSILAIKVSKEASWTGLRYLLLVCIHMTVFRERYVIENFVASELCSSTVFPPNSRLIGFSLKGSGIRWLNNSSKLFHQKLVKFNRELRNSGIRSSGN